MTTQKPRVLALDLAQHFGWAMHFGENIPIQSGHVKLKTKTREHDFLDWMKNTLAKVKPDFVVFEDVKRHPYVTSAHSFGGYRALMLSQCQERKIKTIGVGVKVWKKYITGNGNASKEDDVAAIQKRGYPVTDDNEADAIGILLYALETGVVESG